jgi:hypothetical protein
VSSRLHAAAALCLASVASSASADIHTFEVPAQCGELAAFRARIESLGASSSAIESGRVALEVSRRDSALELRVRVDGPRGSFERVLRERVCADLMEASAIIVVLALREVGPLPPEAPIVEPPRIEEVETPPRDAAVEPTPPDPAPDRRWIPRGTDTPIGFAFDAGIEGGMGLVSEPALGARIAARVSIDWLELEIGTLFVPPRFAEDGRDPDQGADIWLHTWSLAVALAFDLGAATLSTGAEIDAGAIVAEGVGLDLERRPANLHSSVGLRATLRLPIVDGLRFYVQGLGALSLIRPVFRIDGREALFETPVAIARVGFGLSFEP